MEDIGRLLRESREKLGLTLEEVERTTRIRKRHLEALENGEIGELPSPVQARGFLRNYADFLGLDAEAVLLQFAEDLQAGSRRRAKGSGEQARTRSEPVRVRSRRFPWLTSDLFVAMAIVIAVFGVLIWGGSRVLAAMREEREVGGQPAAVTLSTPSPIPTGTPVPQVESSDGDPPPAATVQETGEGTLPPDLLGEDFPEDVISLRILVEKRAFVEVTVDGDVQFSGRVAPGEILEYQGEELIRLVTGNARGLRIVLNGEDQGVLGEVGEITTRLWTLEGEITPTPTVTTPPTATPTPTRTPTPSLTSSPAPTP